MEKAVGSFAIAGATMAQIMHDFGSVEGDCDGILFGRLQRQTTSSMQDDEPRPAIPVEQVTARVTGYFCTGRVQSFYDSTGRLDHPKLTNIVTERKVRGEDPPIGWYLGRRNSTLWPSMRETAVTAYLRSGINLTAPVEKDDNVNLSPELKSLQLSSGGESVASSPVSPGAATRRKQTVDSFQAARAGVIAGKPLLASSSGGLDLGSKRSSSASSPRQDKRGEPVGASKAPLSPCFFVLFTESDSANNEVRTHEYRAFQSLQGPRGISFEPLPVKVVNAGVSFRGFYDSFVPVAAIPSWFSSDLNSDMNGSDLKDNSASALRAGNARSSSGKSAAVLDSGGKSISRTQQDAPNLSLDSLAGEESLDLHATGGFRVSQFEGLYQQMLTRLEKLSSEAYDSSVALRKSLEHRNLATYRKS